MKKLIFLFGLFIAFQAVAQEGIRFRHCSWEEAKAMAKKEKKPIFIDFYTQWCGPCLNMAENIFTLGSVGNFYNDHFVCLKIDAETGEGVELAKKYEVASFPTFVFVNPKTEKAIHISGSNQDRETFLHRSFGPGSEKDLCLSDGTTESRQYQTGIPTRLRLLCSLPL